MKELNFDAGRPMSSYLRGDIDFSRFPVQQRPLALLALTICQRYRYCHDQFERLIEDHAALVSNANGIVLDSMNSNLAISASPLHAHSFLKETLVFQIRRALDSLLHYVDFCLQDAKSPHLPALRVDSIGKIDQNNCPAAIKSIFLGGTDGKVGDERGFIPIINSLSNSMKHHYAHEEVHTILGMDVPTIVGLEITNDFGCDPAYHNHNSYHIMMGFQDTVSRILENLAHQLGHAPAVAANKRCAPPTHHL